MIYNSTHSGSFRLGQEIRMEVDVFDYTTERVLSMECEDRK